jgi:Beta-propeller repeat/Bacterial Ig-like domain (group 1)
MRVHDRLASKSSLAAVGLTVIALGWGGAPIDAARPAKQARTAPLVPQARPAEPDAATQGRLREHYGRLPLSFEKNQGQSDRRVEFISRGRGYTMFLTRGGEAVMALSGGGSLDPRTLRAWHVVEKGRKPRADTGAVLRLKFAGASQEASAAGAEELPGKINYLLGKDPKQWRTGISTYARVAYEDLYPGVDLVYYGNQRQLEYDLIVDPGADPRAIAIDIGGADRLELNAEGDLLMHVRGRQVVQRRPFVYQETRGVRTEIEGRYKLEGRHRVRFQLAAYDRSRPLVIDPTLAYSTYLGGSGDEAGQGVAVDRAGNAYLTGYTLSTDFPTLAAAYPDAGGGTDAFVTKLNPAGTERVYSTYLGGSGGDSGNSVAVDISGNAYVTGTTSSVDFPISEGAFQTTSGGGFDAFVTKLNALGTAQVYSTYLGGSDSDGGNSVAVDISGNAYVTGSTSSVDFWISEGAFQTASGGGIDAFVTKVGASGTARVYSTYLGGSGNDSGFGIAVDATGAYVTGSTAPPPPSQEGDPRESNDFPTTPGAFDTSGDDTDAFVTKLGPNGSALVYSTYVGGADADAGQAVAVDTAGNAYVTGYTFSIDFPKTLGAYDENSNGNSDAFVTKLNASGTAQIYSTYLGGMGPDEGRGVAVGGNGSAYVTGATASSNFPAETTADSPDAFVTKFDAIGTILIYSIRLGGSEYDMGAGIAVDAAGSAYVTGYTLSDDFPVTAGAFDTEYNRAGDVFVSKIAGDTRVPVTLTLNPLAGTNPVDTQHCVTATVTDTFGDPTPGLVVNFSVTGVVNTTGSDITNATGQATYCYLGPPLPGVDAITAYADIDGDDTQDPGEPTGAAPAAKTWTLPPSTANCEVAVTLGGRITAINLDKATFGGTAKSDASGQASGQQEYQDHGPARPMNVHSINVLALVCDSTRASTSIYGQATIDGEGSYYYRISVSESGSGTTAMDTYSILLNGYYSGIQVVDGGKIQVR